MVLSITAEKDPVWEQARAVGPILALVAALSKIMEPFFLLRWLNHLFTMQKASPGVGEIWLEPMT